MFFVNISWKPGNHSGLRIFPFWLQLPPSRFSPKEDYVWNILSFVAAKSSCSGCRQCRNSEQWTVTMELVPSSQLKNHCARIRQFVVKQNKQMHQVTCFRISSSLGHSVMRTQVVSGAQPESSGARWNWQFTGVRRLLVKRRRVHKGSFKTSVPSILAQVGDLES